MQYNNRDGEVACTKCGEEIELGDVIVAQYRRRKTSKSITRPFCKGCALILNLVTEEEIKVARWSW